MAFKLEPILVVLYRRRHHGEYTYLEWASTETLQLQRMAFQGVRSGTWPGYVRTVPTTQPPEETLANLPFAYPLGQDPSEKLSSATEADNTTPAASTILSTSKSATSSNGSAKESSKTAKTRALSTVNEEILP